MKLTKTQLRVLRLRFAIDLPEKVDTTAKETLETIGDELGFSHTFVKKLEETALDRLGIPMNDVLYNRRKVRDFISKIDSNSLSLHYHNKEQDGPETL